MAIIWTVNISPISISNKTATITATRYDDISLETTVVGMNKADISTAEKKNQALDILWNKYQIKLTTQTQVASFIGSLESAAKSNLEGREI